MEPEVVCRPHSRIRSVETASAVACVLAMLHEAQQYNWLVLLQNERNVLLEN